MTPPVEIAESPRRSRLPLLRAGRNRTGSGHTAMLPRRVSEVVVLVLLALAPLLASGYAVNLTTKFLSFAVLAVSVDVLWGFSGLLPFGQGAMFGVGTYAAALSLKYFGALGGSYMGILLAIAVPALIGAILSWFLFTGRTQVVGFGFGIVTLALGLVLQLIVVGWSTFTGGSNGLYDYATPRLGAPGASFEIGAGTTGYYAVLVGCAVAYLVARWFVRSRAGLVLIATSADERRASALGHWVGGLRAMALIVSFGLAGFAGALYIPAGFVTPDVLSLSFSTSALIWVAIGGRGTLLGAVVGALGLSWLQNYLTGSLVALSNMVIGVVLVLIVLLWPSGFVGAVRRLGRIVSRS
jgi:ABC-type branched-subunit amino acid transport system permease subunit